MSSDEPLKLEHLTSLPRDLWQRTEEFLATELVW